MKKYIILLIAFCIMLPVFAEAPKYQKTYKKNLPEGTFKKKKDGTIVQYNSQGKKVGTYKLENDGLRKIK